ncbi:glycosyltransferase family 4 protein [Brasilonema sp. CT11]|nr:glycosyltransferase family 4 protein [Brasilonema sp. CT11]
MKIGILLSDRLQESGGAYTFEQQIFKSLLELADHSQHSFVIFSLNSKPPQEILSKSNIEFVYRILSPYRYSLKTIIRGIITAGLRKLRYPQCRFLYELWSALAQNILEVNQIQFVWSTTPMCMTMDVPYIVTLWDLEHRLQPYFPELSIKGEWYARENTYSARLRRASFILTGTQVGKAEIEKFYNVSPDRIKVVPFPTPQFALDASLSKSEDIHALEKYNLPDNYLFYPAQFWSHKNHANLLLAIQLLRDNYELKVSVVFVGSDKGNLKYIKHLVNELGLSSQVTFLGFVPREDLISLYRHAFALTFMSLCGPDNLPPLEAFALGCPVIAADIPGAREQLGDNALLVNPKDKEQIALAIKSLYDDQYLRQKLVQRGIARGSKWTGKDYVKEVFTILDEFESIRCCWE